MARAQNNTAAKKTAAAQHLVAAVKASSVKPTNKAKTAASKVDDDDLPKVKAAPSSKKITSSSTAEYFSKNLQQVGFSSPVKAVLTTLKEALDNSLDACEDAGILPEIRIRVEKIGPGTLRNTDQILIRVEDNGPGIDPDDLAKVFGEYLASSKFGRGRCSRGQQGIGISAATTWAMQTTATGARVISKKKSAKKALSCTVDMDLKNNRGIIRDKQMIDWDKEHGTTVEFRLDGRIQLNGEGGLLNYLRGTVLLNPHVTLHYDITDLPQQTIERVSNDCPQIPDAVEPHPHTMKLGEFMAHGRLFGRTRVATWLRKGFSRVFDKTLEELVDTKLVSEKTLNKTCEALSETEFKDIYTALQQVKLLAPATNSVFCIGEDSLALSIRRLGDIDYFAVLTRKPMIADFKPVQVEVAIARLRERGVNVNEEPVQVLRFANRVPLQFDKSACAIVKALTSVQWRSYGLKQPRNSLPVGPYIVAVSVVSPFIKFKNASKETIDASDELVDEMRRALMQTGQRLSRYLKRENKADELEQRVQHIEQFGPILVETLVRILKAPVSRRDLATEGLAKILERDTKGIRQDLQVADRKLATYLEEKKQRFSSIFAEDVEGNESSDEDAHVSADGVNLSEEHNDEDASKVKNSTKEKKSKDGEGLFNDRPDKKTEKKSKTNTGNLAKAKSAKQLSKTSVAQNSAKTVKKDSEKKAAAAKDAKTAKSMAKNKGK